jgi:hypothetical protein
MIELILSFFGNFLVEFMTFLLVTALTLRYLSFKHSKRDEIYFSHFTRELSSTIEEDKARNVDIEDTDEYLTNILGRVNQKLPHRNLRHDIEARGGSREEGISLKDYVGSKHGMIASIQNESTVFNSKTTPNFPQLTERIMNNDENWSKIFGFMPIDGITRILDVLPTMFIVLGVFGTFIGISMALPEIAKMDFSNLEESGKTLSSFVVNVTFAMKTSIAGIFFSIVLTLLNTLFPIEATREGTFEKVETVFEALWYHMHTDPSKKSAEDELPKIREALELILVELKNNHGHAQPAALERVHSRSKNPKKAG